MRVSRVKVAQPLDRRLAAVPVCGREQYINDALGGCGACLAGTTGFRNATDHFSCACKQPSSGGFNKGSGTCAVDCGAGQYTSQGVCKPCPANSLPIAEAFADRCTCKPGFMWSTANETCGKCPPTSQDPSVGPCLQQVQCSMHPGLQLKVQPGPSLTRTPRCND
jgi:hypothetical protein